MNAIDERGDEGLLDLGLRRLPHLQHKDVSSFMTVTTQPFTWVSRW